MKLKIVGLGLLVAASGLVAPEPAGADVVVGIGLGGHRGSGYRYRDAARYGFERGQREGMEEGYADGRKGRRFEFRRDGDYRDADDGYKGWMGSRQSYASAFQRGFAEGYRHSFEAGRRDRRGEDDRRRGYDRDDDRDGRDRW